MISIFQVPTAGSVSSAVESSALVQDFSIFNVVLDSGAFAQTIILILFITFSYNIFLLIERFLLIRHYSNFDKLLVSQIKNCIVDGNMDRAQALCRDSNLPIARVLDHGIGCIGSPISEIDKSLEGVARGELFQLEKNVNRLATISSVSPMIGFLGTVVGMTATFYQIAHAGGKIDVQLLSSGIYAAMSTTIAGLVVGICSYVSYNMLMSRIDKVAHGMERVVTEFMELLQKPG